MKLLKAIALDLWDQRLWPLAVLLVAAIAAVPVLLGGPGEPADPVTPPAAAAVAATPASLGGAITAAQPGLPGARRRAGALRDPFARKRIPPRPLADTPRDPGATGGTEAPGTSLPDLDLPPLDLPPLDLPPSGGPSLDPPAGAPKEEVDLVTVRVGRAGDVSLRRDVEQRTPLPSVADPFLVFLGNKPDGASAQFLVSDVAVPTGDGTCRPSPQVCEEIVMQAGDVEFFDVTQPDGTVVQYQLEVVTVGPGDRAGE